MKYLKTKNISKFSIRDNTLIANPYGRVTMETTGALRLPRGTELERPDGVTIANLNGSMRYNTDTNTIEGYIFGVWQVIAAPGSTGIVKQTLVGADGIETIFGPLSQIPPSQDSIIVLVENVMQISTSNFVLLNNYLGSGNTHIEFLEPVPIDKDITIYFGFAN